MIPESILKKLRSGAGAAGLMIAAGSASVNAADVVCRLVRPAQEARAASGLNVWQTAQMLAQVPQLGAADYATRARAVEAITAMGAGVCPRLIALLPTVEDPEIRVQIQNIVADLTRPKTIVRPEQGFDRCPPCGRG